MLFVPDENFLPSKRITRIYTHNDGTMIDEERDLSMYLVVDVLSTKRSSDTVHDKKEVFTSVVHVISFSSFELAIPELWDAKRV